MKRYEHALVDQGYTVYYIASIEHRASVQLLIAELAKQGIQTLHVSDPCDYLLEKRIRTFTRSNNIDVQWYNGPDFITPPEWIDEWSKDRTHFHQTDFYILQRKRLNILMDQHQRPVGGKWTFDADNRKKVPKGFLPPLFRPQLKTRGSQKRVSTLNNITKAIPVNSPTMNIPSIGDGRVSKASCC